jgi:hypothetical protein
MSDPVSWFLIEPGWKVLDSSGDDVGSVEEIVGDSGIDIFNGLAISTGVLGGRRYVPAEVVGEITEGSVQLRLSADEVKQLGDFQEPPPSEEFVP